MTITGMSICIEYQMLMYLIIMCCLFLIIMSICMHIYLIRIYPSHGMYL